jgi:hypothetical protein
MENQQPEIINQLDNFFNISFDANMRAQIKQVALWAKICALCAFAGYVVTLVVVIFGQRDYSLEAEGFSVSAFLRSGSAGGSIVGVLVSALVGGIINYFLYRFAAATGRGVESMDTLKVNEGFNSLRIYFKIFGIILIVSLSLVALGILVAIVAFGIGR